MNIIRKIDDTRREMINLGMEKGLHDEQVIQLSQILDELINKYYKFIYTGSSSVDQLLSGPNKAIRKK